MYNRLRYKCSWPFVNANDTHFFKRLYNQTQTFAHSFRLSHPKIKLVEINIESNKTANILEKTFNIPKMYWQKIKKN